jgi:sugar lactone lactonase YvrE
MRLTDKRPRALRRSTIALLVLAVGATCVAVAGAGDNQAQAGPAYKLVGKWGKQGTGDGQFSGSYGLATDGAGNVYVADSDNYRIQVFSAKGAFKSKYQFSRPDEEYPRDVAVGADGAIWGTTDTASVVKRLPKGGGAAESFATPKGALGVGIDGAGNVYVSTEGDDVHAVVVFEKSAAGWDAAKTWAGGFQQPRDVEASPDGSIYVAEESNQTVRRFVGGRLVRTIKAGASNPVGIGVDLDCNLWLTNPAQRNITRVSPSGKVLATAASPDMVALDVAVGPAGDVYAFDQSTYSVVHFAEDRSKPQAAAVGGAVTATGGKAKVKYTLSGVACPAQISAVASLSGAVTGKAAVKVAAGKSTVLSIPVKGKSGKAQFKIVLKTNGRRTTQVASVAVTVK